MTYNPLIDADVPDNLFAPAPDGWLTEMERVHGHLERAARKRNSHEVFKWLNVMDMLDAETAAWWRERGLEFYEYGTCEYRRAPTTRISVLQPALPTDTEPTDVFGLPTGFTLI